MEIDGIGSFHFDDSLGWWVSADQLVLGGLGGIRGHVTLIGYVDDERPEELADVARRFIGSDDADLQAARPSIHRYYQDVLDDLGPEFAEEYDVPLDISVERILELVSLPDGVSVLRGDDDVVYVMVEAEVPWEPEHGMQLSFIDGGQVHSVGEFTGDPTDGSY